MSSNKKLSWSTKVYIILIGLVLGLASAIAITVSTTETQWSINDFDVGDKITQNMLMGKILGYTCNNSDCSQKIYWKKISTSQASINDASASCEAIGMVLPSADQMSWYSGKNDRYGLNTGTYTLFKSMSNSGNYHWTSDKWSTSHSCSTPGYSCSQWVRRYPNTYNQANDSWGYSAQYYFCVYKQWF